MTSSLATNSAASAISSAPQAVRVARTRARAAAGAVVRAPSGGKSLASGQPAALTGPAEPAVLTEPELTEADGPGAISPIVPGLASMVIADMPG
ncbi:MAG TPA: hypothetical protein VGG75_10400 [Trebonia sp.]